MASWRMAFWHTAFRRGRRREVRARLDAVRSDVLALQNDVRALAGGVGATASDVVNTTHSAADRALHGTSSHIDSMRRTVRRQPVAALVVCMGAGALVGALLSRR